MYINHSQQGRSQSIPDRVSQEFSDLVLPSHVQCFCVSEDESQLGNKTDSSVITETGIRTGKLKNSGSIVSSGRIVVLSNFSILTLKIEPGYLGHPARSHVTIATTLFRVITTKPTIACFPPRKFLPRPRTSIRITTTKITGGYSYILIITNRANRNDT